ncbi:MAG: polysaccharide ABC transporter ATP-binding protein [Tepidisphaeraceae bacterium]
MSSSELAIRARGLSKSYTIRYNAPSSNTLSALIAQRLRHPLRRATRETFWALRDVNFEIRHGEVVGVIGRNGAGKSTLLKILSRITEPTDGEVDLHGRVGSLLEVGTGFHQELTGRENVFLNGAILGMTRAEIRRQFDAIVDFAGVEKFLDTPVKRYSSGMAVRLAFAVAAHLSADILLVDEVLAVGDAEFQKKCLGKMKEVATGGRTVLFVSHNLQSISLFCDRGLFLERGQLRFCGDVAAAIDQYMRSFAATAELLDPRRRAGSGEYRFTSVAAEKDFFSGDEEKRISFRIERRGRPLGQFFVIGRVVDPHGTVIVQCDSRLVNDWLTDADVIDGALRLGTPWLKPGEYRVDMIIGAGGFVDLCEDACRFNVTPLVPYPNAAGNDATAFGAVFGDFAFDITSPKPLARPGAAHG